MCCYRLMTQSNRVVLCVSAEMERGEGEGWREGGGGGCGASVLQKSGGRGGQVERRQGERECASTLKSLSAFYRSITGLPARAATLRPVLRGEKKKLLAH